jgi:predicted flap endonuclease-1-like 5' DNA nuclease
MSRRDESLPTWFWFFLAFPLSLIVVLLWQRGQLRLHAPRPAAPRRPRYTEPDSIPIDLRPGLEESEAPAELLVAEELALPVRAQALTETEAVVETAGPDDLKVVEGIGPAIARLLGEQGITTFQQLAGTPVERLDEILTAANLRRLANPGTWPEQARYAAGGDWAGLERFQATLKGGLRAEE